MFVKTGVSAGVVESVLLMLVPCCLSIRHPLQPIAHGWLDHQQLPVEEDREMPQQALRRAPLDLAVSPSSALDRTDRPVCADGSLGSGVLAGYYGALIG
jgi:hypothetical protein